MKPIKLDIKGINSFRKKTAIDFEKLTNSTIFGIFGKTGSGKSTVLDGIFLALYGKIIRNKTANEFINQAVKDAEVVFYFSVAKKTGSRKYYEIKRNFKLGSDGCVLEEASMFEVTKSTGDRKIIAERADNVTTMATSIVGLTDEEFRTCITIHQGEFSRLLRASNREQVNLIGGLFNLDAFGEKLKTNLLILKYEAEKQIEYLKGALSTYDNLTDADISATEKQLKEVSFDISRAKSEYEVAKIDVMKKEQANIVKDELSAANKLKIELDGKRNIYKTNKNKLISLKLGYKLAPTIEKLTVTKHECDENTKALRVVDEKLASIVKEKNETGEKNVRDREQAELRLAQLNSQKEDLLKACDSEAKLANLEGKRQKLYGELENDNKRAEQLQKVYELDFENYESLNKKLTLTKETIKTIKVNENTLVDSKMYERLSGEFEIQNTRYSYLNKELIEVEGRHKQLLNKLVISDKDLNEIEEKVWQVKTKLKKQFGEDLELYDIASTSARSEAFLFSESSKYLISKTKMYALKDEIIEIDNNLVEKKEEEQKLSLQIAEYNNNYNALLDKKDMLIKKKDEIYAKNLINELKQNAKIGSLCPVCGEIVHGKLVKPVNAEAEKINYEIENCENRMIEHIERRDKVISKQALTFGEIEVLNRRREQQTVELINIEHQLTELEAKYPVFKDASELQIKNMVEIAKKDDDNVKRLITEYYGLIKQQAELEKDCIKTSAEVEELARLVKFIKNEITFTSEQTEQINDRLKQIEKDLDTNNIKQFLNEMEERRIKERALNIELENLQKQLDSQIKTRDESFIMYELALVDVKNSENQLNNLTEQIIDEKQTISACGVNQSAKVELVSVLSEIGKCNIIIDRVTERESFLTREETKLRLQKSSLISDGMLKKKLLTTLNNEVNGNLKDAGIKFEDLNTDAKYEDISVVEKLCEDFENSYKDIVSRIDRLSALAKITTTDTELKLAKENVNRKEEEYLNLVSKKNWIEHKLNESKVNIIKVEEIRKNHNNAISRFNEIEKVLKLTAGDKLLRYITTEYILNIVVSTNKHLSTLTNGRYQLVYESEFLVVDNLYGSSRRSITTLSGGETFLASLALALAMVENLTRHKEQKIEFMFLDEGFGTLDNESLETVMNAFTNLHNSDFSLGIISHEDVVKNRVPNKIEVMKIHDKNGVYAVIE